MVSALIARLESGYARVQQISEVVTAAIGLAT